MEAKKSRGFSSWIKWLVGVLIAILGAGGGIVALLNYADVKKKEKWEQYEKAMESWTNFSPESLSRGEKTIVLRGLDRIDLETGAVSSNPTSDRKWDLLFGCWPNSFESLRALGETSWYDRGIADFKAIRYRDLRDANYKTQRHSRSGYKDFYYSHKSNVPTKDYIFFVKTQEGNVAKVQIIAYEIVDNNPLVCRNVKLKYEVFPVVGDKPKPVPPS